MLILIFGLLQNLYMYKIPLFTKTIASFFFVAALTQTLYAQKKITDADIRSIIEKNASAIRMSSGDRQSSVVKNAYYSSQSGVLLVYLQQNYKGVDVYNSIQTLAFKNDKLVSSSGGIIPKIQSRVNNSTGTPSISPANAVMATAKELKLQMAASATALKYNAGDKQAEFSDLGISSENVKANLIWMPVNNGQKLVLCWQVQVQPSKTPDHWLVRIDAGTGEYVNKSNLTLKCNWTIPHNHSSNCYTDEEYGQTPAPGNFKDPAAINSAKYRVFPYPLGAPNEAGAAPTVVTNPWTLAPANSPATTLKWNDDGNNSYAITRGNNVHSQEDHDGDNNTIGAPGKSSTPLPDLAFDYTPDFNGDVKDSVNVGFALTNLFYWNNIMHDLTYQYGFDEVSGNFQANNLGRGGLGNDYVIADGQDLSGSDNANFATPADGNKPRMQMYLFNGVAKTMFINSPSTLKGYTLAVPSNIGTNNKLSDLGPVTGDIVVYQDAASSNTACAVAANAAALNGKIALIFRGTCTFVTKFRNAQNAGAKAVIVVNNDNSSIFAMPGPNNTISIPGVMISNDDGNAILNAINGGATVNVTLKQSYIDGSLDATVVTHEYTHGISNRLTGGPANASCLENAEQMGEGWSDYYALMATTNWKTAQITDGAKLRPIGTYVLEEPFTGAGIRTYPYTTDMNVNKWTYDMVKTGTVSYYYPDGGEPHLVGEIWCSTIWDMTWNIIQQDGKINPDLFNANNAGGNTVAMKLVTEGMKLQPCSPGFLDGRDAILKADTLLYNGKYSCTIWKAFARRGMGLFAKQGSGNNLDDQVIDYTQPNNAAIVKHVDKDTAAELESLTYKLAATCRCVALNNLKIVDTLPANVTYVSGGTYNAANRTVTFSGINLGVSKSDTFTVKVTVKSGSYSKPVVLLSDSVKTAGISALWQDSAAGTFPSPWTVSTAKHHSGAYSYYAKDSTGSHHEMLISKQAYKISGISTLSFWHYYDTEDGYDGGALEASADSGATWFDLGPYMTQNGYNNYIDPGNFTILSGRPAFSGFSGGFINTVVNLSPFSGKSLMFRFAFAIDDFQDGDGWYIDDIVLAKYAGIRNTASIYNGSDSLLGVSDTLSFIKQGTFPVKLGNFTAQKIKQTSSMLSWQTFQELNSSRFIIERSADGSDFATIGSIAAAGTSNSTLNYQFIDEAPLKGNNYYRLKAVDKNDSYAYSAVKLLNFGDLTGIISITPNPAKDKIAVTVGGNTKTLKVSLVSTSGQRLATYTMTGQYLEAKLPVIAAGVYYVRIEGDGISSQHKIVVTQ